VSYSDYRNTIDLSAPGRQLTFPSIQDGSSFRGSRRHDAGPLAAERVRLLGEGRAHPPLRGEAIAYEGALELGVFRDGRVEMVQDFRSST